ncbi:Spx/MgsR family RNA polymerase-binding regulatory protein [Oligella ureolytica]|jgi:Spx/MgsR family transcriptional regulator|nr:Spx/MgsR family RNA polymerase-binding regulatory protein [Alcaligenaceae bacterium]HZJ96538.1 Spx/MgsR family RNA polymerase-binding regulatory protein [Oligella sp.]
MIFKIFGLKRCSTCVKAKKFLESQEIEVELIDVREQVPSAEQLTEWAAALGWDKLINKASQTWRQLDDAAKELNSVEERIALIQSNPSVMKRPLLVYPDGFKLGFSEKTYQEFIA